MTLSGAAELIGASLGLALGDAVVDAACVTGADGRCRASPAVVFRHVVQVEEMDTDGIGWAADAIGGSAVADALDAGGVPVGVDLSHEAGGPFANHKVNGERSPPTAADGRVATPEDTAYVFTAADFSFADVDADALAKVMVETLPSAGTLALGTTTLTPPQEIGKASLDAGDLTFAPAANANGDGYASFTFRVSDVAHESAGAYTMTIDVTAVNDPATGAPAIAGTARVGETLAASPGSIADIDGLSAPGYAYQWIWVLPGGLELDIEGATGEMYVVAAAYEGHRIRVQADFTDDAGNAEPRTSDATAQVQAALPVITIAGEGDVTEGEAAQFTVSRTGAVSKELLVRVAIGSTGSVFASEFTAPLLISIIAGQSASSFPLPTVDDSTDEADSEVTASLVEDSASPVAYELGTARSAVVSVEDNDPAPVVALSLAPASIAETGGTAAVTADLDRPSSAATTVTISVPAAAVDAVSLSENKVLEIPAGATASTGDVTLKAIDNDVDAPDAQVLITAAVVNAVGFTGPDPVTLTIIADAADNTAPTAAHGMVTTPEDTAYVFTTADFGFADIDAGAGDVLATVAIETLPSPGTLALGATAVSAGDRVAASDLGILAFTPAANEHGSPYAEFEFRVGDGTVESVGAYTMTIDVTAANDPATGAPEIEGTVRVGETLTVSTAGVADVDGTTQADNGDAGHAYTYRWVRVDGGVETDLSQGTGIDYVPVAGDVGSALKVFVRFTDDDGTVETVPSAPTAAVSAGVPGVPRGLVAQPGDGQVELTWDAPASDGGAVVERYRYRVSVDSGVTWSPDWTDVPDGDGDSELADERSATIVGLDNGTEYVFQVRAVNGVGGGAPAEETATPDLVTAVAFGAASYAAAEGGAGAVVSVNLSAEAEHELVIPLTATAAGGATAQGDADADWSGVPVSVTFGPGEASTTFTVTATDDAVDDDGESVLLGFGATLPAGVALGTPSTTSVILVDDETAGVLSVALETIADDDIVNAAEHGLGFVISGTVTTGASVTVDGASVTVEVGATELTATTASDGTWSVDVGSDASYVVEPSVTVTVGATKTGHTDASEETRTLAVDLTAPSARGYTVPASLRVGVAMGALSPSSTSDTDIASYDAAGLPAGLVIAAATGEISGTPSEARATETTATVTVTDDAGNTTEEEVTFSVVSKGNQVLSGFSYSSSSVTHGDGAPAVVAPTGAQTPVTYAAAPEEVCTVEPDTGALTIVGLGNCVVTASAAGDANYEAADNVTFTVQVLSEGMLSVALETIADDDIVNAAEHGLGFVISGTVTTGASVTVDGASVTVEVGATELTATTASDGTWSVNVGSDASYVVEPSVAVTVVATKTGHTDASEVTRPLAVDLTAPSSPSYTAPSSLRVGVAIGSLSPSSTSDTDIASYDAAGLPAGLVIAAVTGVISGTPSEAKATETTATVTVTDTGGNTTEEEVTFPVVSKGSQVLSGFSYSSSSVTYGADEPTVVAPTGAQTPVTYAATPTDVCTVNPDTGALTIVGLGNCVVTASAAGDANYEAAAEVTFTVQVLSAGMLSVALETIADDDIVNAAEHGLGFAISGTVTTGASVAVDGASVTVEVGATELTATTASDGTWSVNVGSDASYVVEPSVAVTVAATKSGHTDASEETRTLAVDLTAPSSRVYTVPLSLQVGVAMGSLSPSSTSDTDIASYDAAGLPAGLVIAAATGEISGTPSEAKATETTATVTVTDTGGNTTEISVVFPVVSKGSQVLSGFSYSSSSVTYGDGSLAVVAPTGAQTPVTYAATPEEVCTVEPDTGALTIVGLGNCVVTASAAGDANYEASAEVTSTVQVLSAGMLSVALETIADDDIVNAAEHGLGFAISGTVTTGGSVAVDGASVTVEVGATELTATTASDGTWSVNVGSDASYVVEPSVAVTVVATKTGHTDASEVTRPLAVDLTAPSSPSYTAPSSLRVGVAIGSLSPSSTSDTDIASYDAAGLPAGLVIAAVTGVISGTPSEAKATETTATVTVTDDAGNTTEEEVTFPVVSRGAQVLSGFSYSSSSVTYGDGSLAVVAPTGAQTPVTYAAAPVAVCTVEPDTGALTIVGLGDCVVRASAAGDANYEAAADVTSTVQVLSAGMLSVALETIADDDIVNAAEHGLGFAISGTVTTGGSQVSGASVTVRVGGTDLPAATTASAGTWSVNVGSDASYVVEPSVTVAVAATKTGHTDASEETRTLAVDLTAPSSRVYTVPPSLRVGVAMGALSPSNTSDTDIASYDAADLPAGLVIAAVTGDISGTPSEAKATETTATVTVTDTGGNTTEEEVTFPVVSKGNQVLSGFSYSSSSVTYGDGSLAVVAPTGAQTPVTYAATPEEVCTVEPDTGALTIVGLGDCVVTASAAGDANYEAAADVTSTVQVLSAGMLSVALETIADDDIVNAAEHGLGFAISGTVTTGGSQVSGASVTVRVGGTDLPAATTASDGTWSVNVGSDASYVVEPSVTVAVVATKTGHTDASEVTRPLAVDLTPPSSPGYTAPVSLQVGVAMGALSPSSTSDPDIASYDAADLPAGLVIAAATGEISGTPSEAKATETTATVTVTDTGGNTTEISVVFPVVSRGEQILSGFSYSSSSVTYGAGSPTVVAPTGAQTSVTYAATPEEVCTVNQDTGALSIVGLGNCVVTASSAADANYEASADVTFTVQVLSAGMLSVALETIADDDIVNAAEHGLGFVISGTVTTGASVTVDGASVTVRVGGTDLPAATTASDGTWSVNVGSDASYVVEPSVAVTVAATKTGHTDASEETRTLAVDLTAPSSRVYTVPSSLQVGVAMGALSPSNTSDPDIASYDAADLPAGLVIAAVTGVISGTPSEAKATETTATVTVTDTGGNTTEEEVTFPVVSKGSQILSGFSYSSSSVTYGAGSLAVVAPTGAQTSVTYAAAPVAVCAPEEVCTVEPDTGALTIVGLGYCVVTASAAADANYEAAAEVTSTVQVLSAGMLSVALETIADDDIVNAAEHGLGFAISGTVTTGGSVVVDGASVTVEVGATELMATTGSAGTWSVNVGSDASYVVEPSVAVTVAATKTGHTDASEETRTLAVDLTAPSSRVYTVPSSLQVGVAMGALSPSNTSDPDIASYDAADLPAGLVIAAVTGVISGTPSEAKATETTATVTVTDTGGNTTEISVVFPVVSKGSQILSGFSYSSSSVTYGAGSLAVVAPTGAQTSVTYAAAPVAVCTVEPDTGALTIVGLGNCVVTASAAADANYEAAAEVTFTVQVLSAGMLSVALETIADDDIVNAAEHGLGFAISGTVTTGGSVAVDGASVTVEVGATELTATTASDGTWSVNVGSDASYVVEPSVAVTVGATKTGHTDASEETLTLAVDLTPPSSPGYTVPPSLQVGVAIGCAEPVEHQRHRHCLL